MSQTLGADVPPLMKEAVSGLTEGTLFRRDSARAKV